jgi:type I restriction enzyme S subunit
MLNQCGNKATMASLNQDVVKRINLKLPSKTHQDIIVDMLICYDDLIENNKRRIELLEESARQLYKEWFVRFRFPGHEHVKIVDGVPEGWEVNNLGNFVNVSKGKNITKDTVVHGEIPVVAGGLKPAYYHNKANTKGPVITISASGANAGYVNLYQENVWASDCSYIESEGRELFIPFYYLMLKERQLEISSMQKGSAQPHVYPKDLMRLVVKMPSKSMRERFTDLVATSYNQIKVLGIQNKQLANARDLLLPKLMNGEITV